FKFSNFNSATKGMEEVKKQLRSKLMMNELFKGEKGTESMNFTQLLPQKNLYLYMNGGSERIQFSMPRARFLGPRRSRYIKLDPLIEKAILDNYSASPYHKTLLVRSFLNNTSLKEYKINFQKFPLCVAIDNKNVINNFSH